jgi:hypothetical protein
MKLRLVRPTYPVDLPAHDERQVTLMGWGVHVQWRGGGAFWLRPLVVEVRQAGRVRHMLVHDATVRMGAFIWLAALLLAVLAWWFYRARR